MSNRNSTIAAALAAINVILFTALHLHLIPEQVMSTHHWVSACVIEFYIGIFLVVNSIENINNKR